MKRFFNTLIICLILVTTDTLPVNARTFALIAGVSNYGVEDANLSQTTKDAKAFKQLLSKQTKDITLLTSTYANHDNILEKLRAICNRAQNGDRVIFYFSGHGNKGYLLTSDIKPLYYTEIANILNTTKASDVICFIDACFAGTLASGTTVQSTASLSNHDGHAYVVPPHRDIKGSSMGRTRFFHTGPAERFERQMRLRPQQGNNCIGII